MIILLAFYAVAPPITHFLHYYTSSTLAYATFLQADDEGLYVGGESGCLYEFPEPNPSMLVGFPPTLFSSRGPVSSLARVGETVAIGRPHATASSPRQTGPPPSGVVDFYTTAGTHLASHAIDNNAANCSLGTYVCAAGEQFIASAPLWQGGSVFIYNVQGVPVFEIKNPGTSPFGTCLAYWNGYYVVAAAGETVAGQSGAGQLYLYEPTLGSAPAGDWELYRETRTVELKSPCWHPADSPLLARHDLPTRQSLSSG